MRPSTPPSFSASVTSLEPTRSEQARLPVGIDKVRSDLLAWSMLGASSVELVGGTAEGQVDPHSWDKPSPGFVQRSPGSTCTQRNK